MANGPNVTDNCTVVEPKLSDMTNVRKLHKRRGILKVKVEALAKGNFSACDAVLDTAAARGAVRQNSPYLLPRNSRAEKRARDSLYFTEDATLFEAVSSGKPAYVKSFHGQRRLTCEDLGIITIKVGKTKMNLLVIIAKPGILPEGVEILLDADTVQQAKIDVTALFALRATLPEGVILSLAESPRVKVRETIQPLKGMQRREIAYGAPPEWQGFVENHEERERDEIDIGAAPTRMKFLNEISNHDTDMFLSEIKCKAAMLGNPDLFKPKAYTIDMVTIAGDEHLTSQQQQKLRALVNEFKRIFSGKNILPKPMKNQPPVKLLFKEGAEPARCAIPRWGPYQEKLLRIWTQQSLKEGLIELVTAEKYPMGCPYASRPHIVSKPNGAVRVTGDYVKVNETIEKRPLNLPNMEDQLRRHLGAKYFTVADAAQGYYQLELDEESRLRCALWTPLGKVVPTRLWMGLKNSGTEYQDAVNAAINQLPDEVREKTSNYLDDYVISGDSFETYLNNTREYFKMCAANGITLNPAKTVLGFPKAKILGREITGTHIVVHQDNLDALKNCAEPKDVHQLKSFLGICAYAQKHVHDFAGIARPLHNLTKKNVPWKWPSEAKRAFAKLRDACLAKTQLHVPDPSKPLYLFTDASDVGMGAHLCQLKSPVQDEDLKKVKDEDKLTVAFYSSSFDPAMQRRPVYYREARAMIWGLEKSKEFTERNPHEVIVVTDHAPLQWVKSTNKGAVSAWLIENVAEIDFRVVYLQGSANTTADALSRPPLVSPSKFNLVGAEATWDAMLKMLSGMDMNAPRVHVWAAQHTPSIQRKVQAWRIPSNPINVRAPKSMLKHVSDFDLILTAPAAEEAPIVAHHILKEMLEKNSTATFGCLIPTDLINYIPSGGDLETDQVLQDKIRYKLENECVKQAHSNTGFTWLLFNLKESRQDKIYTTEMSVTPPMEIFIGDIIESKEDEESEAKGKSDNATFGNVPISDLSDWIKDQESDREIYTKAYPDSFARKDNGLILITSDSGNKVYVPTSRRKALVMQVHREMAHCMVKRVRKVLTHKYIWPRMITDIFTWIAECHECPLAKAKRNIAHNLYSPTDWRKPRTAYGIDFYSINKSNRGHVGVLTVTDLFTRFVMFIPVKDTTAETAANLLMERVVFGRGAFKHLVSDGAKAFVGDTATKLAAMLKINKVETYHYPQGNSITERNHILLGEFLRLLPENRRSDWDLEVGAAAYANNMCANSSTGFSPFELDCGYQPSSTADLMFQGNPLPVFETEMYTRTSEEQKQFVQRVNDLHKIALETDRLSKEITIQKLNNPNRKAQEFNPGDRILFYVPKTSQKVNGESTWKSKHLTHWRRGTVIRKASTSTYELMDASKKTFFRSISLIQKDNSATMDAEIENDKEDQDLVNEEKVFTEGTLLAIREDNAPDNKEFVIVEVLKLWENGSLQVRYFGTTDKTPSNARFSPLWADENDRSLLSYHTPAKRYKAVTAVIDPELILSEVTLDSNKCLSKESYATLEAKGLTMHVLKTKIVSKADRQADQESSPSAKVYLHPDRKKILQNTVEEIQQTKKPISGAYGTSGSEELGKKPNNVFSEPAQAKRISVPRSVINVGHTTDQSLKPAKAKRKAKGLAEISSAKRAKNF